MAAEQAAGLSHGSSVRTGQESKNGTVSQQSLSGQALSSREAAQQAAPVQHQAPPKAAAAAETSPRPGIRRGRGSVPAVPKQGKPASGLERDLRDEIDAW